MRFHYLALVSLTGLPACGGPAVVATPATVSASGPHGEASPARSSWATWASPGDSIAYFVGEWEGRDDIGWVYTLRVEESGAYTLHIDQNTQGSTCAMDGELHPEGSQIVLAMHQNDCNNDFSNVTETHDLIHLETNAFGVDYGLYVVAYQRR